MKNTQSLKLNRDFRRVYKGASFAGGYTVVYARKNRAEYNRLGLTVSKSAGNAVVRNRLKRLMRESYRLMEDGIKTGYDIVIVARNRAADKKMQDIKKDISYSLHKLDMKL